MENHCLSLDGQFLFMDPLHGQTHLLNEGAVEVLTEAAAALDAGVFSAFLCEVEEAGGWSPELEALARSLSILHTPLAPAP
ncbi:hypothetical protein [Zoogloea sp.]|uniref:hypothetical protein n=1 Tax=Zoogloea sp. TaxID=49181 RepID=UPI002617B7E7|nr:hypothetical protein [Zoogloea sp.]MDD3353721.1 hypothetical protein [Zoogloea sp.]